MASRPPLARFISSLRIQASDELNSLLGRSEGRHLLIQHAACELADA